MESVINSPTISSTPLTSVVCLTASWSASNLISRALCHYLKLKKRCNETHYKVQSITGILLSHSFGPLHLQIGLLHTEFIYFLVLEKSNADIIIGRTWLIKHHPVLSGRGHEVG